MTADRPVLVGERVTVRVGRSGDASLLYKILSEPGVMRWWREPDPPNLIADDLRGASDEILLVIEIAGEVAGGIQWHEETEEDYLHAGIDIFLGERWQGQGHGTEAVRLVARFLFWERGHHRLTIDPAADNARAIASYKKVGFRPVGIMRQYERGADGAWHDGLLMDLLRDELIDE
ncbi:MAG TPA: GNAT family protein [Chloroflexota bacterium]|nr:GNAT family protein [Chloroflexota bacterium]